MPIFSKPDFPDFEVGEVVIALNDYGTGLTERKEYIVLEYTNGGGNFIRVVNDIGITFGYYTHRFRKRDYCDSASAAGAEEYEEIMAAQELNDAGISS